MNAGTSAFSASSVGIVLAGLRSEVSVHSVHRKALYLRTGRGLACLLSGDSPDLPNGLKLSMPTDFSHMGIRQGMKGVWLSGELRVASRPPFSVDFSAAAQANSDMALFQSPATSLAASFSVVAGLFAKDEFFGRGLCAAGSGISEDAFAPELTARTATLLEGIKARDGSATAAAVSRLIGFGPGLTPSGDDFLVGVLGAFAAFRHRIDSETAEVGAALSARLRASLRSTNEISASFLYSALEARFPAHLIDFAAALDSGAEGTLGLAAGAIAAQGRHSGIDLAAGFMRASEVLVVPENRFSS